MTADSDAPHRKQARLAVRLTPEQNSLIRDAAVVTGQSLTDFVMSAALERAEDALADRRIFRLPDFAWAEFNSILDRPAQRVEALAGLLNEPAPWEEPTDLPAT